MARAPYNRRIGIVIVLGFSAASLAFGQIDCTGISASSNVTLEAVPVATGLLGQPLAVEVPPGDTSRIFIVEQNGFIRIKKRGDPTTTLSLFLDISSKVATGSEMGLLGLAFDPDYATTGRFYVNYTERVGTPIFTVVARYTVTADPDVADPTSEVRVLRFSQPQSNHNGGQLLFGPDGYLYIPTGDGGNFNDSGSGHVPCGNGQSKAVLLGKVLRLDVRGIAPVSLPPDCGAVDGNYTIPEENPFDDGPGGNCDEIWAYGMRNPWRSSFDVATGDLYLSDVGQNCLEEFNYIPSPGNGGRNFGWRVMEGTHCFNTTQAFNCVNPPGQACGTSPPCNDPSLTLPVFEFGHQDGECAGVGGYVYRGCRMPGFSGTYFYGDNCAGFIKSFVISGGIPTNENDWTTELDPTGSLVFGLSSFGMDPQGEIYFTNLAGEVKKIVPPLQDLEVSGFGAADMFQLSTTLDWTWEDLYYTTDRPVSVYAVYRGTPNGAWECIHTATEPRWPAGGDPTNPDPGQMFAYVVTARNAAGAETIPGAAGTFNGATCP